MSSSIPFSTDALTRFTRGTYVILLKDPQGKLTLLADPGMNRPWSSKNYAVAKFHASECDGEARNFEEAFKLLLKEHPGFEKELLERIARTSQDLTKTILDQNSLKHGINTNAHSSPGTILDGSGNAVPPVPPTDDRN